MNRKIATLLFCTFLLPIGHAVANTDTTPPVYEHSPNGKMIMGEKEWVRVDELGVVAMARVDTGATTSSISAIDIESFERDGDKWVKFRLAHNEGQSALIEKAVERTVRIIQSSSEGYERRYVVNLPITIGDTTMDTEFTLRDRNHLNFPVLLGRTYLKHTALVDVSRKYVQPKPETKPETAVNQ
ncbi:ATP-dependent zinc protease family protein [Enterovibrio calviensis]|uniref:ATP-dependent zinc protease family protein n=1 Tax=Enterovibrio calviensis TaxID=91359 RepID=UPI000687DF28|nr:ATP-dependent zinc protease [Enterovibrio calviensis]